MPSTSNCQNYDQTSLRNYINTFNKETVAFIKKTTNENKEDKSLIFFNVVNASAFAAINFIKKPQSFPGIALSFSSKDIVPLTSVCLATALFGYATFKYAESFKNHCEDADTATRFINDMNLYQKSELEPKDSKLVEDAVYIAKLKKQISERSKTAAYKKIAVLTFASLTACMSAFMFVYTGHRYDSLNAVKLACGLNLAIDVLDRTKSHNTRDAKQLGLITKIFEETVQAQQKKSEADL